MTDPLPADLDPSVHVVRLFVAGATEASQRAVETVSGICNDAAPGMHRLEVVDVSQQPELAARENVLVTPTLIRYRPEPVLRLVGDLSDRASVWARLGLERLG